eukprot:TRINITY_DN1904_c2_g1_i1.p1 TRINITY_DN1904_c2_g1~~TRINITY_DN1904_c2_g1_i1.p1  ORF type:complete len:544 (+),score=93.50 TRINITY_DN1904_c2_g1_i1:40-1671(+)
MDSPYTPQTVPDRGDKKCKIINDPVHGHMEFEPDIVKIIDTLYFQRLRELRQLGSADWVFPGAVHSRFMHSLGVCYLANKVIQRLQFKQPELNISDRDILLVSIAGLCHDLGHGPFSHGFERVVQIVLEEERTKGKDVPKTWHHENASEMLFEKAVEEGKLDIREEEIKLVKAMIRGVNKDEKRPMNKPLFLFQIVANKQTGMDVDKYDYLLRDAMFCGAKIAFDITRLLRPQVRKSEKGELILAYYIKEEWMIHQLFRSRFDLHHQVYGHSVVVAFQLMIEEVLVLAKDWLRISDAITNPKLYLLLTDNVIHRIECLSQDNPPKRFCVDTLRKAQDLIKRIKQRDLYTSLMEDVKLGVESREKDDRLDAERKLKAQLLEAKPELEKYSSDFIVVVSDRDFTRRKENPLKHVPFYKSKKRDKEKENDVDEESVVYLTDANLKNTSQPAHFWERIIRVYCKRKDIASELASLIADAWNETQNQEGTASPMVQNSKVPRSPNASQEQNFLLSQGSQGNIGKRLLFNDDVVQETQPAKRAKTEVFH